MRVRIYFLCSLVFLCAVSGARAAVKASVEVHPTATATADYFLLGDLATVRCSDKALSARLSAIVLGHAPIPGSTRPLTAGDIRLKLRQGGIDPETVTFTGSDTVVISAVSSPASPTDASDPAKAADGSKPADSLIHAGDGVNLVFESSGVVITARVTAITGGAAGSQISVRREGSDRALRGTVLDSQTVRLEE